MERQDLLEWLRETDEARLDKLWAQADSLRAAHVGQAVHFRGLIELSNHCIRQCQYCGISAGSVGLRRYRMTEAEILACAEEAKAYGYGTVVLQGGEDPGLTQDFISGVVARIKERTGIAVTLSLGEREDGELAAWRVAGADRYLLRFETSDPALYARIHPSRPGALPDRIALLRRLTELGYEAGSGVMVGIPGQTWEILAQDIETFRELDLDMIGIGPFIPSDRTPLGGALAEELRRAAGDQQVPNDELTTLKVVALTRLVCPDANLPSTTALATIDPEQGRELGLCRGANIVMPNMTPPEYRVLYEIYPGKACIQETAGMCRACLAGRIHRIGRVAGKGAGGRQSQGASALQSDLGPDKFKLSNK